METRAPRAFVPAQDVYTDVRGLQNLKTGGDQDAALKKIAQQFESMFLHEMLKSMRKANEVFEEDSLTNGGDTGFYRDMYDQQLSLSLAQKGTGLADSIYRQLRSQYVSQAAAPDRLPESLGDQPRLEVPAQKSLKPQFEQSNPRSAAKHEVPTPEFQTPNSVAPSLASSDTPAAENTASGSFESAREFVESILPHAKVAARILGVNPLVLTAQAALETGWGKYVIRDAGGESTHNLFNIKADSRWGGPKAQVNTLEYQDGVAVKERANFRSYGSFAESFADYVAFLQNNPRYEKSLVNAGTDEEFLTGLQQAGYATDPEYAQKILAITRQLGADPALAAAR